MISKRNFMKGMVAAAAVPLLPSIPIKPIPLKTIVQYLPCHYAGPPTIIGDTWKRSKFINTVKYTEYYWGKGKKVTWNWEVDNTAYRFDGYTYQRVYGNKSYAITEEEYEKYIDINNLLINRYSV